MPVPGRHHLLHSALRVSTTSAAWTIAASTAAVLIGLLDDSVALVAFGAVGLFDCAASLVLVTHFRAARAGADAQHLERLAEHVIAAGLAGVGLATATISVSRLLDHHTSSSDVAATVLAAASFVVLGALAWWKRHVSIGLSSRALRADGRLTSIGAVLAGVTLVGTAASSELDWWWADPVAALAIALGAITLAVVVWRAGEPSGEM